MRTWQIEHRKRTRHLIELGGLVAKARVVELMGDERAAARRALVIKLGRSPSDLVQDDEVPHAPLRQARQKSLENRRVHDKGLLQQYRPLAELLGLEGERRKPSYRSVIPTFN